MDKGFTKKDVARISGLNLRNVAFYTEKAGLVPSVDLGRGKGSKRLYSRGDVFEFMVVRQLADYGITLQEVMLTLLWLRVMLLRGAQGLWEQEVSKDELMETMEQAATMRRLELIGKAQHPLELFAQNCPEKFKDLVLVSYLVRDKEKSFLWVRQLHSIVDVEGKSFALLPDPGSPWRAMLLINLEELWQAVKTA